MKRLAPALLAGLLAAGCASPAVVAVKPGFDFSTLGKVALLDFDDSPGLAGSGRAVSRAMEPYLLKAGYSLIERGRMDSLLKEQSLGRTGAVEDASAAAVGRLLGAQALVLGTVTGFSRPKTETYVETTHQVNYEPVYTEVEYRDSKGAVRTRRELTSYDVSTAEKRTPVTFTTPAALSFSARMVDAATGELLWSASVQADGAGLADAAGQGASNMLAALKAAWPVKSK